MSMISTSAGKAMRFTKQLSVPSKVESTLMVMLKSAEVCPAEITSVVGVPPVKSEPEIAVPFCVERVRVRGAPSGPEAAGWR